MNRDLQLPLQVEDLTLRRKGLEMAGAGEADRGRDRLEERINRLRRRVSGEALSLYDRLSRRYPDVLTTIVDGTCQGCHAEVSMKLAVLAARSDKLLQCEHCGRLIMNAGHVPDYLE